MPPLAHQSVGLGLVSGHVSRHRPGPARAASGRARKGCRPAQARCSPARRRRRNNTYLPSWAALGPGPGQEGPA
jgi:hypothetical protein